MRRGWIGVDFDGTLVVDDLSGEEEPVPLMLSRVKRWLDEGQEVRIVTARVGSNRGSMDADNQRDHIEEWCRAYLGLVLKVTAEKDYEMIELWDDRAVQVIKNTGKRVGNHKR